MKLPKTLLAAIVAGITVQVAATSCSKDAGGLGPKDPPIEIPGGPKPPTFPDNCPACGLG